MTSLFTWMVKKGALALQLAILAMCNLVVYSIQLEDTNAYLGFVPIELGAGYVAVLALALVLMAALMPATLEKPSDFFRALYGLFVLLPFAVFFCIDGNIDPLSALPYFGLLVLPMFLVAVVSRVRIAMLPLGVLAPRQLEQIAIGMCVFGSAVAFINAPPSAGFDLSHAYDRRFEAREIFTSGSTLAYLVSMSVNGFVPLVAFFAGFGRRRWLMLVSLLCAFTFFYVSGLKAQFGFVFLAYLIGLGVRRQTTSMLYRVIFMTFAVLFVIGIIEYWFLGFSLVIEFLFRRVFAVPAHVMSSYLDLMFGELSILWSPLSGVSAPEGVTFLIGERYFGNAMTNANTNTFVLSLASSGVPGLAGNLFLVVLAMAALDALYRATRNPALIYLGFVFSMLLAEQAATTALLSSGIAILILLMLLGRRSFTEISPGAPAQS